ncbi:hypothetical protein GCM10027563_01490 [Parasphingorhabdus pacifica]
MSFVLSESCVRRQVGDATTMREQLGYLESIALRPNIDLQVLPFRTSGPVGGVSYDFTMLQIPSRGIAADLEFVYVESFDDARYLDAKDAVAAYATLWNRLQAASLGPKESHNLIRSVGEQHSE